MSDIAKISLPEGQMQALGMMWVLRLIDYIKHCMLNNRSSKQRWIVYQRHCRGIATIAAAHDCQRVRVCNTLVDGLIGGIHHVILHFTIIFAKSCGLIRFAQTIGSTKI